MVTVNNEPMILELEGWRRARGINQSEMATLLGISFPTYVRWEKKPAKIPFGKIKKACDILKIDINNIFLPDNDT